MIVLKKLTKNFIDRAFESEFKNKKMFPNTKQTNKFLGEGHSGKRASLPICGIDDHVIHDEELGQENVELVDSEWADFERALRYFVLFPLILTDTFKVTIHIYPFN